MTRDNLQKRNMNKPLNCVFCFEHESVQHLFFDCIVAQMVWAEIKYFLGMQFDLSFASISSYWIAGKKLDAFNTATAAVMWALWKHMNSLVFNGVTWLSLKQIWSRLLNSIKNWRILFGDHMLEMMNALCNHIQRLLREPGMIGGT